MAKWMPASSRPGMGRSRGALAPPARTRASNSRRSVLDGHVHADVAPVSKRTPSASIWSSRRSSTRFSILNSGMP